MANGFETDANCVAAFLFEAGAFTDDSVGSASLTADGTPPVINAVTYWEGAASAFQEAAAFYETFYVTDEPSDFPLHDGSSETTFSVVLAYYNPATVEGNFAILKKTSSFSVINNFFPTSEYYELTISVTDAGGTEDWETGITLEEDAWHHIGITFNDSTGECVIREYDNNTELVETASHTFSRIPLCNSSYFYVGDDGGHDTSYLDEVAFFKDVLTADEIDEIRAGTFGGGGGGGEEQTTGSGGDFHTVLMGCPI